MKITKSQLGKIIKEEFTTVVREINESSAPIGKGREIDVIINNIDDLRSRVTAIEVSLGRGLARDEDPLAQHGMGHLPEVFGGVTSTSRPERRGARRSGASAMDVPGGHGDAGTELTAAAADLVAVLRDYNINAKAEEIAFALMQQYDLD